MRALRSLTRPDLIRTLRLNPKVPDQVRDVTQIRSEFHDHLLPPRSPAPITPARKTPTRSPAAGPGSIPSRELHRDAPSRLLPASKIPPEALDRLTSARAAIVGLSFDTPRLMGILNVTPDSFSDGGEHFAPEARLPTQGP